MASAKTATAGISHHRRDGGYAPQDKQRPFSRRPPQTPQVALPIRKRVSRAGREGQFSKRVEGKPCQKVSLADSAARAARSLRINKAIQRFRPPEVQVQKGTKRNIFTMPRAKPTRPTRRMRQAALAALHAAVTDPAQPGYVRSKAASALLAADKPEPSEEEAESERKLKLAHAPCRVFLPANGRDAPPRFATREDAEASDALVAIFETPEAAEARPKHEARIARMRRRLAELIEELKMLEAQAPEPNAIAAFQECGAPTAS
jgi:hypothetical protein